MNIRRIAHACLASCLLSASALASEKAQWGYTGDTAPPYWGSLSDDYHACAKGKNQSPINLTGFIEAELAPLLFDYTAHASVILNNGHSIQVNFPSGSHITLEGQRFELKQFHFHTPSEHHIDGTSFPMEAHLVHTDAKGQIAVISIMMQTGASHPTIARLWDNMPHTTNDMKTVTSQMNASELLPESRDYYRFNGSLTTPPCSEGVHWLVLKDAIEVSEEQVAQFAQLMVHPNNRPLQPLHARPLLR